MDKVRFCAKSHIYDVIVYTTQNEKNENQIPSIVATLIYNVQKSENMVFRVAGGKILIPRKKLNGNEPKRVYSFKYLGHFDTDDLRDHLDIERERRAQLDATCCTS